MLSLEHVAAWVADRVLPFLAKPPNDSGDDEDAEKSQPLAAQITEVSFITYKKTYLLVFNRAV